MARPKQIDFGFSVARIARRLRQAVDAELQVYGLTEATWRPLAYVGRLGGGVRQKELAIALSIEGPSLVRLLDNLERRGLIERREDETDRRARGIYLTRAGRDLAVRVAKVGTEIQSRLLAKIPLVDLETCQRVLDRIERELEERQESIPAAVLKRGE
ncbi:MAG: MarR family transcriptional regulator [Alphaproteobacteria bacterium]|nr:MarR family transcriptional regulator [Alphaproteobacteria bacterium]